MQHMYPEWRRNDGAGQPRSSVIPRVLSCGIRSWDGRWLTELPGGSLAFTRAEGAAAFPSTVFFLEPETSCSSSRQANGTKPPRPMLAALAPPFPGL